MIDEGAAPKLTILKASAGSGKTFNLALEYIALAISGEGDFRQVLAVTFTNKATREMKERIVHFLKELSQGSNAALSQKLAERTGMLPEEVRKQASLTLRKILHHYSHFAVSTIDSFNQKILRAFTREIGLIGNFNLELDTGKIVEQGVDHVLDASAENPELKRWLLDFIGDKLREGKSWDIKKDLRGLAMELYSENFRQAEVQYAHTLPGSAQLQSYLDTLKKIKYAFENQMKTFGKKAIEIATRFGLQTEDFKYGKSGVFNYFNKIQRGDPSGYVPTSRVLDCLENTDNWFTQKSPKKDAIMQAVQSGLQECLETTLAFREKNYAEYMTAEAIIRNLYTLGLFSEIKNAIDHYKRENDLFLLSDTNAFLREIIGENEAPFIYEKVGSRYLHYLIDEFQDTSRLQWENFRPLVANALAEGKGNLAVGDAKQSIYRWRGGNWELIEKELPQNFGEAMIRRRVLDTNWRSAPEIVQFNNALFAVLPGVFRQAFQGLNNEENNTLANDFDLIYQDARQEVSLANTGNRGFVRIDFTAKEKGEKKEDWKAAALLWLKDRIDHLQDTGFAPGAIAILTRTRSEGTEVVDFLHEQNAISSIHRYEVISNESLLLKNYPAVRLLINCLRYIKNTDSELALTNVAVEYFNLKHTPEKLTRLLSTVTLKQEIMALFPPQFIAQLDVFRKYGLTDAVAEIIRIFNLNDLQENTACLMAFQDMAVNFVHDNANDVNAFLEWWDEEKDRQTIKSPETLNAIRVMTIHKSKGLEFEVVIAPFLNWDVDHSPTNDVFLWCENKEKPFSELAVAPLRYSRRLADSYFAEEYFDEKHKAYIDNLNLCYVAFTRARKALFLHAEMPAPGKKEKNTYNVAELLFTSLQHSGFEHTRHFNESEGYFELGTLEPENESETKKIGDTPLFIQNFWHEKTALKRRGRDFLQKEEGERIQKINYGLLVHEILAELKDLGELDLLIRRYYVQGLISSEEIQLLSGQFDQIFANPEVAGWFSTGDGWDIKTESSILSADGSEVRPDRVMTKGKSAVIVDFKTGHEEPKHTKQLMLYREKLLEMGYENVSASLLYIASNKVKQIA